MKVNINKRNILLIFIFVVSIFLANSYINELTYAQVNEYYSSTKETIIDLSNTQNSSVLNSIAEMVYVVAKVVENLISWIIKLLTGKRFFPWADRIIFNAMALLDINIFNPEKGSMFLSLSGEVTKLASVVRGMYYTLFVVALSFFGIVIGIISVRLALSTIAAEKAKYKSSIMVILTSVTLIFLTHYLMSFIFFVNEKMVEVASEILLGKLNSIEFGVPASQYAFYTDEQIKTIDTDFIYEATKADTEDDYTYNEKPNKGSGTTVVTSKWNEIGVSTLTFHIGDNDDNKKHSDLDVKHGKRWLFFSAKTTNSPTQRIRASESEITNKFRRYLAYLLMNDQYCDVRAPGNTKNKEAGWWAFWKEDDLSLYKVAYRIAYDATILTAYDLELNNRDYNDLLNICNNSEEKLKDRLIADFEEIGKERKPSDAKDAYGYSENVLNGMYEAWIIANKPDHAAIENSDLTSGKEAFANMGKFFQESAYGYKLADDGETIESYKKSEIQPVGALLYAIFIIQSISFFIVYMKRVFYVIILVLFAPIIIVYDFLTKAVNL